jgi:hypothetical protein
MQSGIGQGRGGLLWICRAGQDTWTSMGILVPTETQGVTASGDQGGVGDNAGGE